MYICKKYSIVKTNKIKVFENKQVRTAWNADEEEWYFSVVDVIEILTDSDRPRKYWNDLKKKLLKEGSELSEKIGQLKMLAPDGEYEKETGLDAVSTINASDKKALEIKGGNKAIEERHE